MTLDTNTEVDEIGNVQDSEGRAVPPASGDYAYGYGENIDITDGAVEITVSCPDRATQLVVHIDNLSGAAHAEVQTLDPSNSEVTQRDDGDNSAYAGSDTSDIFVDTQPAAPTLRIRIVDDTAAGTNNSCDYSLMVV